MDRLEIVMDAINALVPNAQYNIYGDFSGLQWLDSRTAPKEADVKKKYDEIIAEEPLNLLRDVRNQILAQSDWTQSRDVTLSNDADWKTYRQALRDITKDYKSLEDVKWLEKPE